MLIPNLLIGLGLLTAGRQLFWLFVGGAGFVFGLQLGSTYLADQPQWLLLTVALVLGLVGVMWAILFKKVAIGIGGFLGGGVLLASLFTSLGVDVSILIPLIVGGIIGIILVSTLFEYALIVLSACVGAFLIVDTLTLDEPLNIVLLFGLLVAGLLIQVGMLLRGKKKK